MMRRISIIATTAIALALAACGDGESTGAPTSGQAIEKVAAPAGKQWTDTVVKTEEGGYKIGNPQAKLQLVEYGAITCPGCAQFSVQSTEELMAMVNTGVVAMEFRPFLVHGIQDIPGFLIAQCNGTETFFGLTEQLYANQQSWLGNISNITPAEQASLQKMKPAEISTFLGNKFGLVEFAGARGVSADAAKACLADQTAIDALIKSTEAASASGTVTGTPTFTLNGQKLTQQSWPELKIALKNAGAR